MREPRWLSLQIVTALHDEQLARFGGGTGMRDQGLLESALARPVNAFHYKPESGLFDLAAAYGFGIIRNHPFIDGNKRTGDLAVQVFLHLNGWNYDPDQHDEVMTILGVAAGEIEEDVLARWIEQNSSKLK